MVGFRAEGLVVPLWVPGLNKASPGAPLSWSLGSIGPGMNLFGTRASFKLPANGPLVWFHTLFSTKHALRRIILVVQE